MFTNFKEIKTEAMRRYRRVLMMVCFSWGFLVQAQELDGFPNFLDETNGGIKSERLNEITEMPRPEGCEDLAHWATFHLKDQMNQGRFDGMDSVARLALEICPDLNFPAFLILLQHQSILTFGI